jgi:hypothetical protein
MGILPVGAPVSDYASNVEGNISKHANRFRETKARCLPVVQLTCMQCSPGWEALCGPCVAHILAGQMGLARPPGLR